MAKKEKGRPLRYVYWLVAVVGASVVFKVHGTNEESYFTMHMVQRIEERYYLVKRLEQPVEALFKAQSRAAQQSPSFEPFKKIWCNFLSYRYLGDDSFVRETIKLVLLLYKDALTHLVPHKSHVLEKVGIIRWGRDIFDALTEKLNVQPQDVTTMLATNHHATDVVCDQADGDSTHDVVNAVEHVLHDKECNDNIIINNIMRFYHMQRLTKAVFTISKKSSVLSIDDVCMPNNYKHPLIINCVINMQKAKNAKPFFKLWKRLSTYDSIKDKVVLQEFIQLTICLYSNFINNEFVSNQKRERPNISDVVQLYEKIANLPIVELLNLLDDVTDQYESLSTNYEFSNPKMTWSHWLRTYWWVPPITAVSAIVLYVKNSKVINNIFTKITT